MADLSISEGIELFKALSTPPPAPAAVQAVYGDPLQDPELMALTVTGDPWVDLQDLDMDDFDLGEPGEPVVPYGAPMDIMGPVRTYVQSYISNAIKTIGAATGKDLSKIRNQVNAVGKKVNTNGRSISTLRSQIAALRRAQSVAYNDYRKNKYFLAALSAAQSLPGVQAHNFFHSDPHKEQIAALSEVGKVMENITLPATVTAEPVAVVPGAYDQAALQGIIDALVEDRDELIAAVNLLSAELAKLQGPGEELHGAADAFGGFFKAPSTVMQLAKIVPSQLDDQQKAWAESAFKLIFGAAKVGNGSLLNISI